MKKLNQKEFADLFDLTRANIGSYEEGRAHPKLEVLLDIAKKFSINLEDLVNTKLTVNDILNFEEVMNTEAHHLKDLVEEKNNTMTKIPFIGKDGIGRYVSLGRSDHYVVLPASFDADLAVELVDTSLTDDMGIYQPGDLLLLKQTDFSRISNQRLYAFLEQKKWYFGRLQRIDDAIYIVPLNNLFPSVRIEEKAKKLWEITHFIGENRF